MNINTEKAMAVHRQFLMSDRIRLHLINVSIMRTQFEAAGRLRRLILRLKWRLTCPEWQRPFFTGTTDEFVANALLQDSLLYLNLFYGLLYSVIEGWRDARLSDPKVDELLQDRDKVEKLKLLRNATFHVQNEYFSEKTLNFLEEPETEWWGVSLHKALSRALLRQHSKIKDS